MRTFLKPLACLFAVSLLGAATAPAGKLTVTGALRTGIMAIGGETTGTEILQGATSYELDIKDAALKRKAEELNGKQATVTGTLTIKQGPERGQRRIIAVETLEAAR
jgi:hypothetical protein